MNKKTYVVIHDPVLQDTNLHYGAKCLYGRINALSKVTGFCFASDEYLASVFKVDTRTIRRWVKNLKDNKHIKVKQFDPDYKNMRTITVLYDDL